MSLRKTVYMTEAELPLNDQGLIMVGFGQSKHELPSVTVVMRMLSYRKIRSMGVKNLSALS